MNISMTLQIVLQKKLRAAHVFSCYADTSEVKRKISRHLLVTAWSSNA